MLRRAGRKFETTATTRRADRASLMRRLAMLTIAPQPVLPVGARTLPSTAQGIDTFLADAARRCMVSERRVADLVAAVKPLIRIEALRGLMDAADSVEGWVWEPGTVREKAVAALARLGVPGSQAALRRRAKAVYGERIYEGRRPSAAAVPPHELVGLPESIQSITKIALVRAYEEGLEAAAVVVATTPKAERGEGCPSAKAADDHQRITGRLRATILFLETFWQNVIAAGEERRHEEGTQRL